MRGAVVVLMLAWAAPVAAQDAGVDVDAAKAHYAAGKMYYQADRLGEALHEFEEAYYLSRRSALLYNIGLCHERLVHLSEAIRAYQQYLDSGAVGDDRIDAEARIARLKASQPETPAVVVVRAPPPAPQKKPLVRRGWFWGVMGAAVVVVAGAVAVGVVVGTRDNTPVLPDVVPK